MIRFHQKVKQKEKIMNGKFELFQGQDNQFYFRVLSPTGSNLGYSEGYTAKHNAQNGINSVKKNARIISNFTTFKAADDYYYFNLKAPENGEIILRSSKKYTTREGANSGTNEVSRIAPNASVIDLTANRMAYV